MLIPACSFNVSAERLFVAVTDRPSVHASLSHNAREALNKPLKSATKSGHFSPSRQFPTPSKFFFAITKPFASLQAFSNQDYSTELQRIHKVLAASFKGVSATGTIGFQRAPATCLWAIPTESFKGVLAANPSLGVIKPAFQRRKKFEKREKCKPL